MSANHGPWCARECPCGYGRPEEDPLPSNFVRGPMPPPGILHPFFTSSPFFPYYYFPQIPPRIPTPPAQVQFGDLPPVQATGAMPLEYGTDRTMEQRVSALEEALRDSSRRLQEETERRREAEERAKLAEEKVKGRENNVEEAKQPTPRLEDCVLLQRFNESFHKARRRQQEEEERRREEAERREDERPVKRKCIHQERLENSYSKARRNWEARLQSDNVASAANAQAPDQERPRM